MKISKFLLLSIVIGGLATSCEKAYVLPEPVDPGDIIDPTQPIVPISFTTDIPDTDLILNQVKSRRNHANSGMSQKFIVITHLKIELHCKPRV